MAYPADFLLDRLLYRDGLTLVINKPAGLPVHAGPGGGDNLENYFDALRFGLPRPPALAHRLDRDTSGCLVLGRHPKALRKLHRLFSEGLVEKTYWAICRGAPDKPSGTIDTPLTKGKQKRNWRMELANPEDETALSARTTYRMLGQKDGLSFIEAKPKTGRTHQIRVHLASVGAPIIGDELYGGLPAEGVQGYFLHAESIRLVHPESGETLTISAPLPKRRYAWLHAHGLALRTDSPLA